MDYEMMDDDVVVVRRPKDRQTQALLVQQQRMIMQIGTMLRQQQSQLDNLAMGSYQGLKAMINRPVTPPIVHVTVPAPVVNVSAPKAPATKVIRQNVNLSKLSNMISGQTKKLAKDISKKKSRPVKVVVKESEPKFSPMG